jgi:predicted DNA-binding transcriptional regulator AlpA
MPEYLTPKEVSKILSIKESQLAKWRMKPVKIPFIKIGQRVVRYKREDVISFMESRRVEKAG